MALDTTAQRHLGEKFTDQFAGTDSFEFLPCDVSDYKSLAQVFQSTFNKRGRIDAFCCNAGIIDVNSIYIFDHRGKKE